MDFTANYNLKKPTLSDPSDITELGVNFDTIDAALKGLDTGKGDRTEYRANANLNLLLDDKAYVCGGTMQNVPVPNSYCIVRVYDSESTNRIVQVCYVPQTDNTVRTFVRAAIGNSFGSWRELATNAYVDGKNDTNAMLIEENTFRFKALANSMTKSLTTFFVETFENTDDVNSTKGDGAAVIGSYYNAAAHAIIKGDTGAATFYSAAKIVTTGNNNVWAFWEWQDMGGGSVEVAVSRDNGVTFTAVPNNTLVSISSQPAGASVVYRVAMTGKVKFKNLAWGMKS